MNQSLFIYFKFCWIFGLVSCAISYWADDEVILLLLILLVIFNGIVNSIFIVFQAIMIYFFPENRDEFFKTILLLMVNFPFVLIYLIIGVSI